jgi:hypothetical protein
VLVGQRNDEPVELVFLELLAKGGETIGVG